MSSFLLLFLFLSSLPSLTLSDPRATKAAQICTNKTVTSMSQRQIFVSNFLAAMDTLTPLITTQRYAAVSNGTQNATVFAFAECMKDLSQSDCNLCIAQCKTQILTCLPFQKGTRGGRLFFDGCYLRYDDYSFFNESLSNQDPVVCGNDTSNFGGVNSTNIYDANALELVRNLSVVAVKNDGFSVGFVNRNNVTVYGLAQCWEFVTGSNCRKCLDDAVTRIGSCKMKQEGRVLNSGCYLRYSPQKFYNNSTNVASSGNHGNRRVAKILAGTSAGVAFLLVVATVVFFIRKNVMKKRRERKQFGALLDTMNKSKLNVPYEILEKATKYFNDDNKLGQGGSGSVYKGVMPDGNTVAIKRLSFNSTQWVDHFFNEVNLISGIHHKNLVKLLGCSITGPESLLVYEYVPNLSLHDHLSVRRICPPLTWEVRHKIILGIAEGMAYLHEESPVRIIHRDIKLSNILLEDDFTPKIADFGLARLFPEDNSHISTAVAGTLGYMAPEYVVRGKLSEKADVYSFGVLVVEIVTGKRNSSYVVNSSSILQMVWSLYGSNRLSEIVDPILEGNFSSVEACRLLQIGLLCAQASAELRPSMSVVVKMINNNHEIPQPTQPPFISSGSSEISKSSLPGYINFQLGSNTQSSGDTMTESLTEPRELLQSEFLNEQRDDMEEREAAIELRQKTKDRRSGRPVVRHSPIANNGRGSVVMTERSCINNLASKEHCKGDTSAWINPFLEGLCKYLSFSKLKVKADLKQGDLLHSSNLVCSLSFDRDGEFFATAGVNKKIKIFECDTIINEDRDIHYPVVEMASRSKLSSLCWNSYIKSQIASSNFEGVVQLWDVTRSQVLSEMREHERRVWSIDFSSADPTMLASGSDDGSVKLWSINQGVSVGTIKTKANVCCVQFPLDSARSIAFGSADHRIYYYDLRNLRVPLCTLVGHNKTVSYIKFVDNVTLVSSSTDNTLKLWDLSTCTSRVIDSPIQSFTGHMNVKNFVGLSVSDGYIATGSETNEVFIYHKAFPMPALQFKFQNTDPLSGHEVDDAAQFVSSVCWRGQSPTLIAANSTGNVKILEMV